MFQDLNRLRQIAVIAGKYGFADLIERSGLWKRLGRREPLADDAETSRTQSVARRFRLLLAELGPTFVKLGQVLSTRGDILPSEFVEELAILQDQAPPLPMSEVQEELERAFGKPLGELFERFDPEPLAAASIAQVHRARTHDGAEVVVKVQRPGIAEKLEADVSLLFTLARTLEAVIEEVGVYTPSGIVEEFDRSVREELDFLTEASNVRAFVASHRERPGVRVPKVYDELCARTVLTLELLDGPKLSAASLSPDARRRLAEILLEDAFRQVFEDGLFHGDPHPGNLLVLDGPVIGLIDFGLVGRVTRQMQDALVSLVLALALKDAETAARILYRLGTPDSRANLHAFRGDIDALLNAYMPRALNDIDARLLLRDLLSLAVRYRIRVPKEYAILTRAAIAVEGVLRGLYPDMPVGELFLPYAKRLLAERYDPTQLQGGLLKTLLRLQSTVSDLPLQLTQILLDLESGKFTVAVKSDAFAELNASLRALGTLTFAGLCACGLIVGTFVALASKQWEVHGLPVLGLVGGAGALALVGVAVARQAWGSARKLSIKRLGRR